MGREGEQGGLDNRASLTNWDFEGFPYQKLRKEQSLVYSSVSTDEGY